MGKVLVRAAVGALAALPLLPLAGSRAGAQEAPTTYQALAAADGFRFSVSAPGLSVVNTLVDVGGPVAQASVDNLGTSTGFAAYPDPGELVLTGPGLLAGATQGAVSFPPYPLAVQTTSPATPDGKISQGPYLVEAHSTPRQSTALARSGNTDPAEGHAQTTARAALDDKATTIAEATSTVQSLTVGPLVIGSSVAKASASVVPGQPPKVKTEFHTSGVSVNDTPVGVTPAGLVVGGTTTPLPEGDPARQALAAAGIDVAYLTARSDKSTARSAGLQVTLRQQFTEGVPGAIPAGQVVEYRIVLGQAVATVAAGGAAVTAASSSDPAPAPPAAQVIGSTGTASASAALPSGSDATDGATAGATPTDPSSGATAAPRSPADARPLAIARAAGATNVALDTFSFYWVLVVGAGAAGAALHVNRTARHRRHWLALLDGPLASGEGGPR